MSARIFVKRLASVEIDPSRSNQHEFNAGRIRRELGLPKKGASGQVVFFFYTSDGSEPEVVEERYTLYDSRKNKPERSAESRMYYTNNGVAQLAYAGDLMLLCRPDPTSNSLLAVVARQGTVVEKHLTRMLADRDPEEIVDHLFVDSKAVDAETLRLLMSTLETPVADVGVTPEVVQGHPLFGDAVASGNMPTPTAMAEASREIVQLLGVTVDSPDDYLRVAPEAETDLFMSIEKRLGNRELAQVLRGGDPDFQVVMAIFTSYSQRRRSRRGQSLENHFRHMLEGLTIPHSYQCITETGRKADFIIPSCQDYHNLRFPEERLRMVGCKTVVRERHAQLLDEADRVHLKYLLCLDRRLSDHLVEGYQDRIRFFLPRDLLESTYADRGIRALLGSVADLVDALRPTSPPLFISAFSSSSTSESPIRRMRPANIASLSHMLNASS